MMRPHRVFCSIIALLVLSVSVRATGIPSGDARRSLTRFGCFAQRRTCCFKYTPCGFTVRTDPKLKPCPFNKCLNDCTGIDGKCTRKCKLVQATCETLETRRFVKFCLRKFCFGATPGGGNAKWPREFAGKHGKLLAAKEGRRILKH